MTIKQFLRRHVEGYLFKDLRTMNRVKLRKGQKIGGVGYPMLSAILAGIEMLGGLLQQNRFDMSSSAGFGYFDNYWTNYLVQYSPQYARFSNIFRQLIRNGIAHTYLTKTGVWVIKGDPSHHLELLNDGGNYYLIVDVKEFLNDFTNSYLQLVRPIVYGGGVTSRITKDDMQVRLNEMISDYEVQSNTMLRALGTATPIPSYFRTLISGASTVNASGTVITYSGTGVRRP